KKKKKKTQLYQGPSNSTFFGFLVLKPTAFDSITIYDSWNNYKGIYLFGNKKLTQKEPDKLAKNAKTYFQKTYPKPHHTMFAWIDCTEDMPIDKDHVQVVEINSFRNVPPTVATPFVKKDALLENSGYNITIHQDILVYPGRKKRVIEPNDKDIQGFFLFVHLETDLLPLHPAGGKHIYLSLTGDAPGALNFQLAVSDFGQPGGSWPVGLRYVFPKPPGSKYPVSQFYPLFEAAGTDSEKKLYHLFYAQWKPFDFDHSSLDIPGISFRLQLTGGKPAYRIIGGPTPSGYTTCFRDVCGKHQVVLYPFPNKKYPPKFVFNKSIGEDGQKINYLVPSGKFELGLKRNVKHGITRKSSSGNQIKLLCGLAGTEFIKFTPRSGTTPGDILTFVPGQGAEKTGDSRLSDKKYTTARVSIHPSTKTPVDYYAQPADAALYHHGKDDPAPLRGEPAILDAYDTKNNSLNSKRVFPMVPYAGVKKAAHLTAALIENYEYRVIAMNRKMAIDDPAAGPGQIRENIAPHNQKTTHTTTPQGFLAEIYDNGPWESVTLTKTTKTVKKKGIPTVET
ncbi:MAG: hypothetical protein GY757_31445, partial [bacterium]|nr:hypothetical protein [bacterium]